jgi:hypothetical protein
MVPEIPTALISKALKPTDFSIFILAFSPPAAGTIFSSLALRTVLMVGVKAYQADGP